MKEKFKKLYMTIAETVAEMSYARRLQVGAIVVKDDRVISMGYNGMPSGWDNNCENEINIFPQMKELKTKPEVIHAEANAIAKLAKGSESGNNSTMFLTHAPCLDCAKQIFTAGISKVYYRDSYRDDKGVVFLQQCGVEVDKYSK